MTIEPRASAMEAISPRTTSEKYSAGPNFERDAGERRREQDDDDVATVPAKNEPSAAVASAAPARPCRAIWWPSMAVTAEDDSPGG